jgi:hypothetical protein
MRTTITALLVGSTLATPIAAQAQNVQQMLQGLLTGNQQQDQSLRDAWRRGYDRGRQDQARDDRRGGDRYDRGPDYRGQGPYGPPPDNGYPPPPGYPPPR